jgi:hypothetical protein
MFAWAIAAGCDGAPDRLVIDVDVGASSAEAVKLVVGLPCDGQPCATALTPTGTSCAAEGSAWALADPTLFAVVDPKRHHATFSVAATLPAAVAYGGTDRAYLASAIVHDVSPTSPTLALSLDNPNIEASSGSPCTRVGEPAGGDLRWTAIGPSTNPECLDLASVASHPADAYCALPQSVAGAGACVLGLPRCATGACAPITQPTCVPADVCPCANGSCLTKLAASATRVECTVPVSAAGDACPSTALTGVSPAEPAVGCGWEFATSLTAPRFAPTVTVAGLTLLFDAPPGFASTDCKISASGTLSPGARDGAALAARHGATTAIVPVRFAFQPGTCGVTTATCKVVPEALADPVWRCAALGS